MVPESFFPIFFIAIKNSHKLWVRTMLLWLQAEAVGREKPPAVLIFHAPGSVNGSFLQLQVSAENGAMKLVKLVSVGLTTLGILRALPSFRVTFPLGRWWASGAHRPSHTSCFLSKENPGEGQRWSCGVPVLWPAAHHRARQPCRGTRAIHDIWMALGIYCTLKNLRVWYESETCSLHHPHTYQCRERCIMANQLYALSKQQFPQKPASEDVI